MLGVSSWLVGRCWRRDASISTASCDSLRGARNASSLAALASRGMAPASHTATA